MAKDIEEKRKAAQARIAKGAQAAKAEDILAAATANPVMAPVGADVKVKVPMVIKEKKPLKKPVEKKAVALKQHKIDQARAAKVRALDAVDEDVKCDVCGKMFFRYRAHPYLHSCKECRCGEFAQKMVKKCACGASFLTSKYNEKYTTQCIACRAKVAEKLAKRDPAMVKPAKKAPAHAAA